MRPQRGLSRRLSAPPAHAVLGSVGAYQLEGLGAQLSPGSTGISLPYSACRCLPVLDILREQGDAEGMSDAPRPHQNIRTLTGRAKIAGVFGWPVTHSSARRGCMAIGWRKYNIDGAYLPFATHPGNLEKADPRLPSLLGFPRRQRHPAA